MREADLITRCEQLEAGRQASGAEREAAADSLRQSQAAAAKVCSCLGCISAAMPTLR